MKTYITYPTNPTSESLFLLSDEDNFKNSKKILSLDELGFITNKDILIYLIPSSLVSSYKFDSNEKLSLQNNMANFISEVDTQIVNDVSDNEFFIFKNNGFVINKELIKNLNNSLSNLKCKVFVMPDYFINFQEGIDSITEFNDRFVFSFDNGTGTSINEDAIEQYIEIIKNNNPNYNPNIFSKDKSLEKLFKDNQKKERFTLKNLIDNEFKNLPNFFKFDFSFKRIFKRLDFSKNEVYLCLTLLFLIITLPNLLIYQNNKNTNIYESETFNIFKKIDKNIKRVVSPTNQIDQLIQQIPINLNSTNLINKEKFNNLDFVISLGDKFIDNVEINFNDNIAVLSLDETPKLQYNLIKNISTRFDISIIDEDIRSTPNTVSGKVKIRFNDE
tara:strand:+ start:676 stop:1839 length:1164 start_codon:yes stop_codon:yes gene_type:complete